MSGASKILIGSGAVADPVDDEFDNVSFLSHFDGSNNGTNIVYDDGSASNHTISVEGTPSQGTFGPFARPEGEWSNYFDGSDYFTVPSSSDFDFGTGDFTWEAWVYQTSRSAWANIFSQDDYHTGNSISCWITDAGNVAIYYVDYSSSFTTTSTFPLNTWTHLAFVRKGTGTDEFSIYINGVAGVTGTMTTSFDQDGIVIGRKETEATYYYIGYMSNFRIVKGTAVYTGNFTPPTAPLTAITNTKLLTCQSNRFKDNSASAHALTAGGTPKALAFTPFLTSEAYDSAVNGASGYFDGTGDCLKVNSSSDFAYGTGDFTIEFWFYWNDPSFTHSNYILDQGSTSKPAISIQSDGHLNWKDFSTGVDVDIDIDTNTTKNEWHHVAVCRASGTVSLYFDGTRTGTTTTSSDFPANALTIGQYSGDNYEFTGYLSNFRIVTGTAVYSGTTLTVPTAPLTAITNTKLLLNMADGQALDSAAQNNLTLLGNADTSTTQQKFGTASLALDGTGDYVTLPSTSFAPFGTGDFTVECWVYFETVEYTGIWQADTTPLSGAAYIAPVLEVTPTGDGGAFVWSTLTKHGGDSRNSSSVTPSTSTWYHTAVVRTSGTIKVFVDGTQVVSDFTDTTDFTDRDSLVIGGFFSTDYLLDGYIDEFRISHVARYTSNFTAPTTEFPNKGQES